MNRTPVQSSRIASVGYDNETKTLEIEFTPSRRVYRYYDVPERVYRTFMTLPDKGFYFEYTIKNLYDYKEVTNDEAN